MSTTSSTPELRYTVVGGDAASVPVGTRRGVSAIVLDRSSGPTRAEALSRVAASGVDDVLAVLGPEPHYEVEQLADRLPRTRFLLLGREAGVGEAINVAVRESTSPYLLVVWSDIQPAQVPVRLVEQIRELDVLCAAPVVRNDRGEVVPSMIAPAFYRSLFRTVAVAPGPAGGATLVPWAHVGVYDRARFEQLGGFDAQIDNPYWQLLDFGLRAYLWGERIAVLPAFRAEALRPPAADDTTPDLSYARFHLRNLSIRFVRDQARLQRRRLPSFLVNSGLGWVSAIRVFMETRRWVHDRRYRFVQDARRLTELWEIDT